MRPVRDRPNEPMIHARLCAVIDHLRESVDERLALMKDLAVTREQALACLPLLRGKKLAECFELLLPAFSDDVGGAKAADIGSFWHNFWCH
jgi:hypothetical protein